MTNDIIIIEKLRKILTLASDKGATEGEMQAAMAKATELALRHNIDLGQVDMDAGGGRGCDSLKIEKDDTLQTRSKFQQPYHRWIFNILQEVFEVRVVTCKSVEYAGTRLLRIWLIGEATDVAIAKVMFAYLEEIFPRTLSKGIKAGVLSTRMADVNGCYLGLARGIKETNRREKEKLNQDEQNCLAMVLVKKDDLIEQRMKDEFPKLKQARASRISSNYYAQAHGYQEGKKINLRQVAPSSARAAVS